LQAVKSRPAGQFNLKTKSFFYDPTEGFSRLKFWPVLQGGRLDISRPETQNTGEVQNGTRRKTENRNLSILSS
jgi:hypothetical protein